MVAKAAGPGGAERAVQLLHRISPWPPFFHMEEDVLRQTLQVGFSPSGILQPAAGPAAPGSETGLRGGWREGGTRRQHRPRRRPLPAGGGCRYGGRSGAAGPALCWLRGTAGGRRGFVRQSGAPWSRVLAE